jgi:hypothetical protein
MGCSPGWHRAAHPGLARQVQLKTLLEKARVCSKETSHASFRKWGYTGLMLEQDWRHRRRIND